MFDKLCFNPKCKYTFCSVLFSGKNESVPNVNYIYCLWHKPRVDLHFQFIYEKYCEIYSFIFFYQIRCHGSILILPESGNEHLSTFQQFNKKQAGYITVYWKFPDKLISYFALTSVWFRVTFAIDMPK